MSTDETLTELHFTVSGRISRPCAEVYEAVADPAQLSKYFTTGGATGRLETGTVATWDFHDFPGAFPVTIVEAVPNERIVIRWGGEETTDDSGDDDHDVRVRTDRRRHAHPGHHHRVVVEADTDRRRTRSATAWAGPGCSPR